MSHIPDGGDNSTGREEPSVSDSNSNDTLLGNTDTEATRRNQSKLDSDLDFQMSGKTYTHQK
jgi:hypothetical protein